MRSRLKNLVNRDVTFSVASQILVSGLNFLVGIIAARTLGVADFGLFSIILLMVSFSSNIEADFITVPMMTIAGSRAKRSSSYFSTIMFLGLAFGMASAVLVALFVVGLFLVRAEAADLMLVLATALITLGQNVQGTVRRILFARGLVRQAVTMDVVRLLLIAGTVGCFVAYGATADVALVLGVLGCSALISVLPFVVQGLKGRIPRRLPLIVLRRHWPISSWLLLMMLVAIGQEQALWVIANIEFGDAAIGGLRAGQYLLGTTHWLIYAMEYFMPRTAAQEMRKDDVGGLIRYLAGQTLFVGLTSLAVIVPIAIFAESLLILFFGADYGAFAEHTFIFAFIYAITITRMIWAYYLRVVERTRDLFVSYIASSSVALLLIYPMIAWFGLHGITLTMLIAQAVLLLGIAVHISRHALSTGGRKPARIAPEYTVG